MKTYYDITVDLYDLYPLKKIEAQQNNIGRGARITLTAGGLVLGLDGESVTMWAKKPDGTVSYLSCSVVDGKIQADFTSQMLAVPGDVQVELRLVNGEENITTPIFSVHVRKSNIDDSAAESTNEFTALASMVAEVNEMKKTALKGDPGEAATLEIGTVEASEPGSAPSVTNSGTAQEAILNFILPRGQTGPEGPAGQTQIHFSAAAEFPAAGNSTMLYVDNTVSPAIIYTWTGNAYVQASADISTVMAMLATPYDPDQDYTAGQYVTYNKQYWKFTATKSAGEWDASKAVATNVGTEISALNANLKTFVGIAFFEPTNTGIQRVDVVFEHQLKSDPVAVIAIYNDTISVADFMGPLNIVIDSITKTGFSVSAKRLQSEYRWMIKYIVYY